MALLDASDKRKSAGIRQRQINQISGRIATAFYNTVSAEENLKKVVAEAATSEQEVCDLLKVASYALYQAMELSRAIKPRRAMK